MKRQINRILSCITEGILEYEKDITKMSNIELYEHVYDDYSPEDFASKELVKRGIGKCDCSGDLQIFGCAAKDCCIWVKTTKP